MALAELYIAELEELVGRGGDTAPPSPWAGFIHTRAALGALLPPTDVSARSGAAYAPARHYSFGAVAAAWPYGKDTRNHRTRRPPAAGRHSGTHAQPWPSPCAHSFTRPFLQTSLPRAELPSTRPRGSRSGGTRRSPWRP